MGQPNDKALDSQPKNASHHQKYRYSISQLIQLSDFVCHPFDLSKFSYDAARGESSYRAAEQSIDADQQELCRR